MRGKPSGRRRRTPPPPASRSAVTRTPDEGGRLARSLTRREDWPRDAVGVHLVAIPLPHCRCCRVPSPGTAQSNGEAVAVRRLAEGPAASTLSLGREASIAPGSPSPRAMQRHLKAGSGVPTATGGSKHPDIGLRPEHPLLIGSQDQGHFTWHVVRLGADVALAIKDWQVATLTTGGNPIRIPRDSVRHVQEDPGLIFRKAARTS